MNDRLLDSLFAADRILGQAIAGDTPAADVLPVLGRLSSSFLAAAMNGWEDGNDWCQRVHTAHRDLRLAIAGDGFRTVRGEVRRRLRAARTMLAELVDPARKELEAVEA